MSGNNYPITIKVPDFPPPSRSGYPYLCRTFESNMKINLENRAIQWLTLLVLAFIWGSSFILIRKGLDYFHYQDVAAFRLFVASIVLLPIAVRNVKELKKKFILPLLIVGLVGTGVPAVLFAWAQTAIDSSLAGILNSLVPLFALMIGVLFFKMKVVRAQGWGVLIGLAGATGLILLSGVNLNGKPEYGILIVLATICYALSVNTIKVYLKEMSSVHITALSLSALAIPSGLYLVFSDFPAEVADNPDSWIGLIYLTLLAVFSSAIAIVIFNMLIKRTSTLFATSVTYLIPVVAIFWGLIAGESLRIEQFVMFALILSGVYLVNRS